MKKASSILVLAGLIVAAGATLTGARAEGGPLRAGFGARTITPVGPSPAGWDFWVNPVSGIWSEPFTDANANGYFDPGEAFTDDPRNTLIDPQSAGKFDGCWTNAGFSGRGPTGVFDDVWARALVLETGDTKVAVVSLDAVGFFYEEIERIRQELAAEHPSNGIDMVILSSTHTHESCDTMGYWGNPPIVSDGKFPLWQQYIRSRIVDAITEADGRLEAARVKSATTVHLAGIRDSRNPDVKDPSLQAAQFVRLDGSVMGTIVNWSNHPEALANNNRRISSDFPHGARARLEEQWPGSTAIYFSGSVGGLMTPLGVDMGPPYGSTPTKERAYYIGRLVADAAIAVLASTPLEDVTAMDVRSKEVFMRGDNVALRTLNTIGIFDKPTYVGGVPAGQLGDEFKTQLVSVAVGDRMRLQTVPGELFPEIEIGGYGRTNCPAGQTAETGRPYEPVIRGQFGEENLFVLGLAQDELGYIVPGSDFWADGPRAGGRPPRPIVSGFGQVLDDAKEVPAAGPTLAGMLDSRDPCGEDHYEESVSASSIMAPVVACTIAELAGKDPWNDLAGYPACSAENTTVAPQGLHPNG